MKIIFLTTSFLTISGTCMAFMSSSSQICRNSVSNPSSPELRMATDPITSLRTEWISAALCTNQIPRTFDTCVQLGSEDGRIVTFVPLTIREIITSSLEKDGILSVAARRRLKQSQQRRNAATVKYVDQPADDLNEIADESVDAVVCLQAAQKMHNNGLDWKKSVREAARVLKPGGRFLFVENTEINGESFLEYVEGLYSISGEAPENIEELEPIFDVGYDEVDLVLSPHIAGVAVKTEEAGLGVDEIAKKRQAEERERLADLSIQAYERGLKKRKRKKKVEDAPAKS